MKEKLSGLEAVLKANQEQTKKEGPNRVLNYKPKHDINDDLFDIKFKLNELFEAVKYKYTPSLSPTFAYLYKQLLDFEYTEDFALDVCGSLSNENSGLSKEEVIAIAREKILKSVRISSGLEKKDKQQVVTFVGPSGNGKTMSLVKLAIVMNLLWSKVLIVSSDTYKVGGSEQLQTYASIAGIPFKTAYSSRDLKKIVSSESDYDFIFIDTKGSSHKSEKDLNEIADIVKTLKPDKVYLTVSTNLAKNTLKEVFEKFDRMLITDLVLTKLDETESFGGIISIIDHYKKPISYITYGQRVPEQIIPADKKILGKVILPKGETPVIEELIENG